jgi:hypothetical protein
MTRSPLHASERRRGADVAEPSLSGEGRTLEELMHKPGLAIAATVSVIAATLFATHAHAVTLGGPAALRVAVAAVGTSEQVCYGCPYCGCGPPYGYYYPHQYYYSNYYYERPRHFSYYYDPGPYRDPLDLNWGVHTRWADGFSHY